MRTRNDYIALIIGLPLTCASTIVLQVVGKPFVENLTNFGTELPFLLRYAYLLWFLPEIVLVIWLSLSFAKRCELVIYLVTIGGVTLAYAATVVVIQLKIHRLAATIAA